MVILAESTKLQSYILSTTTETGFFVLIYEVFDLASIVHPFNNNWNRRVLYQQRYYRSFNRTSFQQQLKHGATLVTLPSLSASIVHPFNNNWNGLATSNFSRAWVSFNRTSFQQQLKLVRVRHEYATSASIVHPFNNNWNIPWQRLLMPAEVASIVHPFNNNWNNE